MSVMMSGAARPEAAHELIDWLLRDGRTFADAGQLLDNVARRLVAAGLPLWRLTFHLPQLHPLVRGETVIWRSDRDSVESQTITRGDQRRALRFYNSPVGLLYRSKVMVRRRLAGEGAELDDDFPMLDELRADGGTDYALFPILLSVGRTAGFGMTTRRDSGFSVDDIAIADAIMPALTAVVDVYVGRMTLENLLNSYVGREAARRILQGQVTLTASRSIQAVIFFCDMRDFTAQSERLPRNELLELLNGYFGCVVRPLHRRGGEVLKFLGDGLLAIFRLDEGETVDVACAKAIIAAFEAVQELNALNERRTEASRTEVRAGIALHVGPVIYGNIGAEDRLDFTVIGPSVNKAARLEALCAVLGKTILTSGEFAAASPILLNSLGRHTMKGIAEPQEVFAPDMTGGLG